MKGKNFSVGDKVRVRSIHLPNNGHGPPELYADVQEIADIMPMPLNDEPDHVVYWLVGFPFMFDNDNLRAV